jgi:nucleoside-diphosphate-sugar epimerase
VRTALVTGAGGFIGGHMADRLARTGIAVRGLIRKPAQTADLEARNIRGIIGDLLVAESLIPAVAGCDLVVHCAAWVHTPFSRNAAPEVNSVGTRHLIQACLAARARRVVHVSSISVYGPTSDPVIDETARLWPLGPYRSSKIAGEREVELARAQGLETVIVRPGQVFGPGDITLSGFIRRRLHRGLPLVVDGGTGFCHPVYVDNLVDALMAAALAPQAVGLIFNVADGDVPWHEFLGYFAHMDGRPLRSVPAWMVRGMVTILEGVALVARRPPLFTRAELGYALRKSHYCTQRARTVLGWTPRVSLKEAMDRTEAWLRQAH